jgi:hypothetical protein
MRLSPFVLVVLASTSHAGNTWYVDVNAAPPGTGTPADPYASIQHAIDQPTTLSGDTILVAPGVYSGTVNYGIKILEVRSTSGPLATRIEGTVVMDEGDDALVGFHVIATNRAVDTYVEAYVTGCILECAQPQASGSAGVFYGQSVHLANSTIVGFERGVQNLGFVVSGGSTIENTLFFGNKWDITTSNDDGSTLRYSYWKTVSGGWITDPPSTSPTPGLWNPAASDFHLAPLSVCIDAGDPTETDPDGSRRDIGAIPYDASYASTPTTYCTPKTTSKGCAPLVTWTGAPSLSGPDDFFLTASPALNKKVGKFVWGTAPKALPFAGGSLCVKLPFVRGPHLDSGGSATGSDCTGVFTWHFSQAYMASKGVTAGAILYAQAWGRDQGFAPPNNSQLSNAIVFQVAP